MNQLDKLYIAATGMITPVGATTEMTASSLKAGISAYGYSKFHHGNDAIKMASVPDEALPQLNEKLSASSIGSRQSRMLKLSHAAIEQILPDAVVGIPLYLAGPEPLPNMPLTMRSKFLEQLQIQSGVNFDLEASKVFPMGRAAGFYALEAAFEFLSSTNKKFILVGGVDTFADFVALDYLASQGRIQTEAGQADAFVPGEGAAFILLTNDESFKDNGQIYRPGIAEELGHRYSDEPYRGDGLASAFNLAIEYSALGTIDSIYSSLNGESMGAKEFGVACMRNSDYLAEELEHIHPADCFGDLGGAMSIVLTALSISISGRAKIIYGASDYEFRGAVCIG